MFGNNVAIVFLPTDKCNAQCLYCFEARRGDSVSLQDLSVIYQRIAGYLSHCRVQEVEIYWQGGEVMMLSPEWCLEAGDIVNARMTEHGLRPSHHVQTNLMDYGPAWDQVIFRLFGGSVGSSLDYPNLYRRYQGLGGDGYNERWISKFKEARCKAIDVSIITVPNGETLLLRPVDFYSYFAEHVGLTHFQVNTPFPGGPASRIRDDLLLDPDRLGDFLVGLLEVWLSGDRRVSIAPFQAILERMADGESCSVPCFFCSNCVNGFLCIGPRGELAQCDCWVTSYPDYGFGNVLEQEETGKLFQCTNRLTLAGRVTHLLSHSDCSECRYFPLCHGGCAVRAMSAQGNPYDKDPYCHTYQKVFASLEEHVTAGRRAGKKPGLSPPRQRVLQWGWTPPAAIAFCSYECTNNCIFCAPVHSRRRNPAHLDQDMFDFINACARDGVNTLFFSGAGEPTLNPHLVDYVRFAKKVGISELFMFTNGHGITESLVDSLKDAGMQNFWVSLHGIGETHDRVVRRRNSFQEAYRALDLLNRRNPRRLNVNTCVNMLNIDQIELILQRVLNFQNVTAHCLCLPEWDGNAYRNRSDMCRLGILKERLSEITTRQYPLLILDNVPHCVAPHLPHIENCDYSLRVQRDDSEQHVSNADNMGHNRQPAVCSEFACRFTNVCIGVDKRYLAEYGDEEICEILKAGIP